MNEHLELSKRRFWLKKKRWSLPLFCLLIGLLIPDRWQIPVLGASPADWHKDTFWYEPWGSSITHKGIDIFGKKSTTVLAANHGIIIFRGELSKGGKVIAILGPKWRINYYAHLDTIDDNTGLFITSGETIGTLGASGNAANKPPHLHFSILSLLPYFWQVDTATQGWKKMFYLDPNTYILDSY